MSAIFIGYQNVLILLAIFLLLHLRGFCDSVVLMATFHCNVILYFVWEDQSFATYCIFLQEGTNTGMDYWTGIF